MTPRRIILVGPSGSGKTSVGRAVAQELGIAFLSMDDFRARKSNKTWKYVTVAGRHVRNFEDPSNWDCNAIAGRLLGLTRQNRGFVVEGNHLLQYPEIAALTETERYYLDVSFDVSISRRTTRHRFLPADESFVLIGRSETRRWVEPQKDMPGIRVLDGLAPIQDTVRAIVQPVVQRV